MVDGLPAHKTKLVKDYVLSAKGRLTLHFLPGYAPELNPDELVWSYVKRTGSDGMLKFVLQKRLPERWGDQPKTVNQNLSLRLMSPEQREEEDGRILLRIAALGIPLIDHDGEAIDISDIEAEAEAKADRAATAQKP